jgi:translation initiation factor 2 subunit 1
MVIRRTEWPEVGDLIVATVNRIVDYGAYVYLDEYGKEGLLHISEISSSWIRNIRDHVREGQKLVLKVLRVNPEKGHIDLSLRRVTKREKIEKIYLWKRERKAESLLRSAAEKLGLPPEQLYEKAVAIIEEKFGGVYEGLEKVVKEGSQILVEAGVPEEIATVLEEIAKEKIRVPMVKIKGVFELQCLKPDGAKIIKEALLVAKKVVKQPSAQVKLYIVAPPHYAIEIFAEDYKKAERILEKATEAVLRKIRELGGQGSFKREK